MKFITVKSYDELSVKAADIIAEVVKNKPDCVLGLATGSSPLVLIRSLPSITLRESLIFLRLPLLTLMNMRDLMAQMTRAIAIL